MSIVLSLTTKQTKALTDLLLAQPPTKEIVDIYAKIYKLSPAEQSNIGTALIGPSTELNFSGIPDGSDISIDPNSNYLGLSRELGTSATDQLDGDAVQHSTDDSAGDGLAVDVHQHVDGFSTEEK